jgi:hypothetical protein
MNSFNKAAAQGDLFICKIDSLPDGFEMATPVDGRFIVALSETHHHHVVEASDEVKYWIDPKNMFKAYLVVEKALGVMLEHCRPFDTHQPINIPKGIYELRRQREYVPEGWRMVAD